MRFVLACIKLTVINKQGSSASWAQIAERCSSSSPRLWGCAGGGRQDGQPDGGPSSPTHPPAIGEVWALYEADKDEQGIEPEKRWDWRALEPELMAGVDPAPFPTPTLIRRRSRSPNKIRGARSNKLRRRDVASAALAEAEVAASPTEAACPPEGESHRTLPDHPVLKLAGKKVWWWPVVQGCGIEFRVPSSVFSCSCRA